MDISVEVLRDNEVNLNTVWLIGSEREETAAIFAQLCSPRPCLITVDGMDWNRDLSPWKAEKVFRNGEDFGGEAEHFLQILCEEILPEAEEKNGIRPASRGIAGYSLAGLFAVWSLFRTDRFTRAASMSGSLWFPGFRTFIRENAPMVRPERIYLSVGDREKKTKNPLMATVEDCTYEVEAAFAALCPETRFVSEPGNHFVDAPGRIARGIDFIASI